MQFTDQKMQEILAELSLEIEQMKSGDVISFEILDPDEGDSSMYAGEPVIIDGKTYLYHGYKSWIDLAAVLGCKMLTPHKRDYPFITMHFEKLYSQSFHNNVPEDKTEKYGTDSPFFTIRKMEEPAFLYYYLQALENVNIAKKHRILNLGINRGDEFETILDYLGHNAFSSKEFVGIDYSESAIAFAKEKFPYPNICFMSEDINYLDRLSLGRFDLLISIGTLQSPGIEFKPILMKLVQEYLDKEESALILGFPNSRWIGGEMVYGAKAPNYRMSELSLLFNDVMFAKKYLQQHKYRVTITGKEYIFLTATKIKSQISPS